MTTGSTAANAASFSDERQLVELSKRWGTAMNDHDRVTLEELMAPEFVLHKRDNTRNYRSQRMVFDVFAHIKIVEFELTAIIARVYGDVGVVTSKFPITLGTFDDRPMGELHGYLTDVWRRTNGRWQVVSRTSADLPGRERPPEATIQKNS